MLKRTVVSPPYTDAQGVKYSCVLYIHDDFIRLIRNVPNEQDWGDRCKTLQEFNTELLKVNIQPLEALECV